MRTKEMDKHRFLRIIYCLFSAWIVLMICSRSSFLYPFNNWDDVNSYFTMGKSMMRGVVPYRDLFDQKGILLYFFYGIGYKISHTSFYGVFLLEILAGSMTAIAILNILQVFVREQTAFVLMPVTMALMYSARSFYRGGSAEEFLLPFLLWGLSLILRHVVTMPDVPLSYRDVFIGGVCAGCVFHIKFNSIGFYIGWVMAIILLLFFSREGEKWRRLFLSAVVFLAGVLLISLPFIVFFGLHGAIDDWYRVYLYDNLFIYSESLPFGARMYEMCKTVYHQVMANKRFSVLIIFGILSALCRALILRTRQAWMVCILLILTCGWLLTGIFIGGVDLPYYPFPMSAFAVIGMIEVGKIADRIRNKAEQDHIWIVVGASVACAILICYMGSMNTSYLGTKKEEMWLFKMQDHILASGVTEPKIINMMGFDAGLYTVLDSVPECYYFQTQTIPLPGIWETQKDYVKSGAPDYVLSCDGYLDFNTSGYHVVMQERVEENGYTTDYWLYEKDTICGIM